MSCIGNLRQTLIEKLQAQARGSREQHSSDSPSLKEIEDLYENSKPAYGVAGLALKLKKPELAFPLLKKMLGDENGLVAIEAAAVFALLGSRSGVDKLKAVSPLSNSGIEFFYSKAALILLGEPIPASLQNQRSVFQDLEALIQQCQRK